MFEPNTQHLQRVMLEAVARGSPDDVVVMVSRMRGRGHSYSKIAGLFGPRPSCPSYLLPVFDRIVLFASLEPAS